MISQDLKCYNQNIINIGVDVVYKCIKRGILSILMQCYGNVVIVNIEAVTYFQKLGNKMCVVESCILQAHIYA